jgi:hypothetical protein
MISISLPSLRNRKVARLGLLLLAILPAVALAGSPGFKHEFVMRGQVLEAEAGTLVVCVGEQDGAEVGQVLNVVRHVRIGGAPKKAGPRYRREPVGRVRIIGLFDGHYADAKVVAGAPKVNDTVELATR